MLEEDTEAVTFSVRDSGIGIAPGDLPHIFERFWRADPARSRTGDRPGVGLGLAITKWIAEAHGGSITVQSRPGRGSVFIVRLPKTSGVTRFRVGFRAQDGSVVAHVDRRGQPLPGTTGGATGGATPNTPSQSGGL